MYIDTVDPIGLSMPFSKWIFCVFVPGSCYRPYDQFWTAGNDRDNEGIWVWGTSNHRIDLDFWGTGEPNSNKQDEDCMTFASKLKFGWNDTPCQTNSFYICEMEDPMQYYTDDVVYDYDDDFLPPLH